MNLFFCVGYTYSRKILKEDPSTAIEMGVITAALFLGFPLVLIIGICYSVFSLETVIPFNKYVYGLPPFIIVYYFVSYLYRNKSRIDITQNVLNHWDRTGEKAKTLSGIAVPIYFLIMFIWMIT